MPPHAFPKALVPELHAVADRWFGYDPSPRRQVEKVVDRGRAYEIMQGLYYSGFTRDPTQPFMTLPVPVCVQVHYRLPAGGNRAALMALLPRVFAEAFR